MHFAFIPYGERREVELLLREMEAQKHYLKLWKGEKEKFIALQGQVRFLPFGVYEYVFPREDLDRVLSTLIQEDRYLTNFKKTILRKALKMDKIPEYNDKEIYLWIQENVNIIPIGIKEDKDIVDPLEEHRGWTHEAI